MDNKIYYDPVTQYENTGDILINKSLLSLLREHGELIIDDKGKPDWFIESLLNKQDTKLSSISHKNTIPYLLRHLLLRDLFKKREHNTYLILVPGDTSRKGLKPFINKFKEVIKLYLLKLGGCRVVRVGFSIGPFDNLNLRVERLSTGAFYSYGLRDKRSISLANSNKFQNVSFCPDLAWSYKSLFLEDEKAKSEYIVLSFRSNKYGSVHDGAYLLPVLKNLKAILSTQGFSRLKVIVSYQVLYDRDACIQIVNSLTSDFNVEFLDKKLALEDCIALYKEARCIISNRLHVLLLGVLSNTLSFPLINIDDNKKIASIYADNDVDFMILDNRDKETDNIKKLVTAQHDEVQILSRFKEIIKRNRLLTVEVIDKLFN